MEKLGVIKKGTIIAGDNIVYPGAPDYLKYFQTEALERYRSTLYHTYNAYQVRDDAMLLS